MSLVGEGGHGISFPSLNGSALRIGLIHTRWNAPAVNSLVAGVHSSLAGCDVLPGNVSVSSVPGAFELPLAAKLLALSGTVDAIICIGVLVKGDTMHFEYIADAVAKGIMDVNLETKCPTVFGVLTCLDDEQVKKRSEGENNHGISWGKTAVEMALLKKSTTADKGTGKKIGF